MSEDINPQFPQEDIIKLPASLNDLDHLDHHPCAPTQPSSTTNLDYELALAEGKKVQGDATPAPTRHRVLRGWILLNEGITPRNFYFSWVYILFFGFIMISFSTLEPQFINQALGVPLEDMGKTTALLYLIDYSVRLCFAMIWGPMIDYYGRKFVMAIGIVLVSLGYLLIPFLSTSLFPGFVIAKSFLSCGLIALSMLPFSADYIDNSTKGVMTGINFGMGFVGGALAGIFIKVCLYCNLPYRVIYLIQAPILLVIGFLLRTGIKGGNTYYKSQSVNSGEVEIKAQAIRWKEIKKAYKEIPWVSIGVIFGVLGNTDFYIMTTGLMIWLKSLIPPTQDPTVIATTFQVIFFGLSVFSTATAALKIDKIPHMKLIFPVLIVSSLGFIIIPFVHNPQSWMLYFFFVLEGLSLPGVFVFSTFLSIRYNPPEIRGTLSGIGNVVCFLGAIAILSLGGYLHDVWRPDASFLLYGGLLFATLFIVSVIYYKMRKYMNGSHMTERKTDGIAMIDLRA